MGSALGAYLTPETDQALSVIKQHQPSRKHRVSKRWVSERWVNERCSASAVRQALVGKRCSASAGPAGSISLTCPANELKHWSLNAGSPSAGSVAGSTNMQPWLTERWVTEAPVPLKATLLMVPAQPPARHTGRTGTKRHPDHFLLPLAPQ